MLHLFSRLGLILFSVLALLMPGILSVNLGAAAQQALQNPNWSGYVAAACHNCQFRYVQATWRVPAINYAKSPYQSHACFWVGLDGWTSGTVEQIGIDVTNTEGDFAWWYMFPQSGGWIFAVNPGDLITASVYYNAVTHKYQLTLKDQTSGWYFNTSQSCPSGFRCGNVNAEVITEAPAADITLPLADFGTVTYTSIRVTSRNGTRGGMVSNGLWTVYPINLVTNSGHLLAAPNNLISAGTAFTDVWHAAQ